MSEILPAILEDPQANVATLPVSIIPQETQEKLDNVVAKWSAYNPPAINDAGSRELEYVDYSARKKLIKAIEAKQKLYNQPIKELLDRVNSAFKKAVTAISSANVLSEKVIQDYDAEIKRKLEAARREQQRILDAEAAAERARLAAIAEEEKLFGDAQKAAVIEQKIEEVKPVVAGLPEVDQLGERLTWHFEITDPDKVPDLWRIPSRPDEVKIGQMVRNAQKGSKGEIRVKIDGVRVYSKTSLAGAK